MLSDAEYQTAIKNYEEICSEIGLNYKNIVKTIQKHTDNVMTVERIEQFNLEEIPVDGICTNKTGNILATTNADCILLMFFDPVKKVIANTHSGWRGTLQRISVKTVDKMKQQYGCNSEDIICCICPSIRKCHFEVDRDVKELFEEEFKELKNMEDIIEETVAGEKWNIDTVLINKIILKEQGIREENIIDSGICSVCNKDKIHSFRAEGENYGLSTAIISLK